MKLSSIIRPTFDPFTGGKFATTHNDLTVACERDGDSIVVTTLWSRNERGTFDYSDERIYSVQDIEADIEDATNGDFLLEDDVPEGFSQILN